MEFAASSFTWAPLDGSDTNAADAGQADASVPASIVAMPRVRNPRFISGDLLFHPIVGWSFASLRVGPEGGCRRAAPRVSAREGGERGRIRELVPEARAPVRALVSVR